MADMTPPMLPTIVSGRPDQLVPTLTAAQIARIAAQHDRAVRAPFGDELQPFHGLQVCART